MRSSDFSLVVGLLIWLIEHRHNEDFGGGVKKGLGSSVLWATAAMTQRGLGNLGPRTLPGRMVAMLWMVGSIIAIAVFTAGITSALTVRQLQGSVHGVADLATVRVGATTGTSSEEGLTRYRIPYRKFDTPQNGLKALRAGRIDAFVYDKPLLVWIAHQEFGSSIQVLDLTFDPQVYAIALPNGSPLRRPLDVAVLDAIHSSWWDDTLFRYLGGH